MPGKPYPILEFDSNPDAILNPDQVRNPVNSTPTCSYMLFRRYTDRSVKQRKAGKVDQPQVRDRSPSVISLQTSKLMK